MNKTRRPGDQAPPIRTIHRNEHLRTATTHVKDTAGKLFCVHDGSPEQNVLRDPITGNEMSMLSYEAAKKAKDIAVAKLRQRKATIAELDLEGAGEPLNEREQHDSFMPPEVALPDPQLEAARQKAIAAARPVAAQAQKRADSVQRAPGWEPPPPKPSPRAATGKAAGWTPPPAGVSSAGKASAAKPQQAAGWQKPDDGLAAPAVNLDDPNSDAEEGDDLSDLMVNPDLETDVKAETQRAIETAKKLWDAIDPAHRPQILLQIARAVTERDIMYTNMDQQQIEEFETIEHAYKLLFATAPQAPQPQQAEAEVP